MRKKATDAKTVPVMARVSPRVHRAIVAEAQAAGWSKSQTIRNALVAYYAAWRDAVREVASR